MSQRDIDFKKSNTLILAFNHKDYDKTTETAEMNLNELIEDWNAFATGQFSKSEQAA